LQFSRTRQLNQSRSAGTLSWNNSVEPLGSARYNLERIAPDEFEFRLVHIAGNESPVRMVEENIRLVPTQPHYGGRRWFFQCPGCKCKARKLYLPPTKDWFRCRTCYRLSYRTCQESHTAAGFFHRMMKLDLLGFRTERAIKTK
jgi:hypothetical protein